MKKIIFIIGIILFIILTLLMLSVYAHAQITKANTIVVTEEDGSPISNFYKLKFQNGTISNNGDGSISIDSIGGVGSDMCPDGILGEYCILYQSSKINFYIDGVLSSTLEGVVPEPNIVVSSGYTVVSEGYNVVIQ